MSSRGAWWPLTEQGVQWDPSGKPYYNTSDGKRDYIPPVAAAQYRDDPRMQQFATQFGVNAEHPSGNIPGGGLLHQRGVWNSQKGQYDQPIDWGNLMSMGVGGFLTGGLLDAFAAPAAGGSAAAGGTSAGASGASGGLLPGITTPMQVAAPAYAGTAGMSAADVAGGMLGGAGAGATAAGATAGAGAASGGSGLLNSILKGLKDYGPIAGLGLAGANAVRGLTQGPPAANEDLKRILGLAEGRVNATEPLFQALNAMATAQLPKYSKGQ